MYISKTVSSLCHHHIQKPQRLGLMAQLPPSISESRFALRRSSAAVNALAVRNLVLEAGPDGLQSTDLQENARNIKEQLKRPITQHEPTKCSAAFTIFYPNKSPQLLGRKLIQQHQHQRRPPTYRGSISFSPKVHDGGNFVDSLLVQGLLGDGHHVAIIVQLHLEKKRRLQRCGAYLR